MVSGTFCPRLTSSLTKIDSDDINIKDCKYIEIITQRKCFPINSSGINGKNFLLNSMIPFMKLQHKKIMIVASFGLAAALLIYVSTGNSTFNIPLDKNIISTCNVPVQSKLASILLGTDVTILYEIVMMHKHCPEAVDILFKDM